MLKLLHSKLICCKAVMEIGVNDGFHRGQAVGEDALQNIKVGCK
jgi:hypothetical protein